MPQPDLALLRPRPDFYAAGHPAPEDVLLVVEVADTSATADRAHKLPLYAGAGVVEVWLVDLVGATVEVWTAPAPTGYGLMRRALAGDHVAPAAFPEASVAVADLLT